MHFISVSGRVYKTERGGDLKLLAFTSSNQLGKYQPLGHARPPSDNLTAFNAPYSPGLSGVVEARAGCIGRADVWAKPLATRGAILATSRPRVCRHPAITEVEIMRIEPQVRLQCYRDMCSMALSAPHIQ